MTPTQEIIQLHKGAIRQAEWTQKTFYVVGGTPYPRFKKRPIPKDCKWYHPCEVEKIPEPARTQARKIIEKHPRTRGIIAWTNPSPMPTYKPTT